jgi:hypothetical protein
MSLPSLSESVPSLNVIHTRYCTWAPYHKSDRYRSRPFYHPSFCDLFPGYDGSVAEWAKLVITTEPFVETLGVESVGASQAAYLRIFIELIEADRTGIGSVYNLKIEKPVTYHTGSVVNKEPGYFSFCVACQS